MDFQDPDLHFLWLEVAGLTRAVNFYRDTLGFPVQERSERLAVVHLAQTKIYLAAGLPRNASIQIAIAVPDIDKLHQRLRLKGLAVPEVSDEGWARYISITDRDGYRLLLLQETEP